MDDFRDEELDEGGGFDPGEIVRMFLRRKWLFLVPFALCLSMAYVAIKTMDPIYQSAGELRVIRQQTVSRALNEGTPRYSRSRNPDRETEVLIRTIVTSPKFLERVVREMNLHRSSLLVDPDAPLPATMSPEQEEKAIARLVRQLEKWIRVKTADTHIFSIGVRHTNADLVDLLASEIMDRFLATEQASRQESVQSERDFMADQRDLYERNLQDKQAELTSFQRSLMTSNLSGNPVNEGNLSMADMLAARLENQALTGEEGNLIALRQEALGVLPAVEQFYDEIKRASEIISLTQELTALEAQRVTDELHGGSQAVDRQTQLGSARLNLDNMVERRVAREYTQLDVVAQSRASRYLFARLYQDVTLSVANRLQEHVRAYRRFMTRQPEQSSTLSRLLREVESAQEMLRSIEEDIRRQNLSLAASMSDIGYRMEVYRSAAPATYPVEPDKKKLAMMGFALAFAIGVGLVLLAEMTDRSLKSVQQIESTLGVKVIGTLPMVKNGPFQEHRRRRVLLWIAIILIIAAVAAVGLLWVYPMLSR